MTSKNKQKPRLSILIVHYRGCDVLEECLHQIQESVNVEYEVLIGNNNPQDRVSIEKITTTKQGSFSVIHNKRNIGFGPAHNALAGIARSETLLILNPDIKKINLHEDVITLVEENNQWGMIAPQILDIQGNPQEWSSGDVVTPLSTVWNKIATPKKNRCNSVESVGWVTGAAFFISKDLFTDIGGFDEKFFLYFEDVDLCRRIKAKDFEIGIDPKSQMTHIAGTSRDSDKSRDEHYAQSHRYYFTKYHGHFVGSVMSYVRRIYKKY